MLKVCRVAETSGGSIEKVVVAVVETQEEAEERILQEVEQFEKWGRNEEDHYWWGRNEGKSGFKFFIEGDPPK